MDAAVLAKLGAAPDWNGLDPEAMSAAQQMWRKVESKDASGADWGRLGIFLSVHNAEAQALTCWSNAMILEKNDVRWPYLLAMQSAVLDAAGKEWLWSEAVRCAKGTEKDWARYRQALFWAEEGKWEQVEGGLSGWVQGDQNFAPARLLWAQALLQRGDLGRAREVARGLTGNVWSARVAWGLLSQVELRAGNSEASRQAAQRQAQSAPSGPLPDPFLEQLALQRDDARALAHPLHDLLASQRLVEAEPKIQELLGKHPEFAEGWMLQGRLRFIQGRLDDAEKALRQCVSLEDSSVQGWFQLGLVLLRREQWQDAVVAFRKATDLKPGFGPAYYNLGYALARKGDREGAVPEFRQAIRYNPENVDSYVLLADLYRQLGRFREMTVLLDQAEVLRPGDRRVAQLRKRAQ